MRTKNITDGLDHPSFIEAARKAQIIECAIETIADLGYAQASLAQIAKRASISKSVISYYFSNKEDLIEQVVAEVYAASARYMEPQIKSQPTATLMLQTYIRTNIEYIGAHLTQILAIVEIFMNFRTEDGKLRYDLTTEEPILAVLEFLLLKGQRDGEFREFDRRVMALTIRRSIDTLPAIFAANQEQDVKAYAQELVTLFDHATRKA